MFRNQSMTRICTFFLIYLLCFSLSIFAKNSQTGTSAFVHSSTSTSRYSRRYNDLLVNGQGHHLNKKITPINCCKLRFWTERSYIGGGILAKMNNDVEAQQQHSRKDQQLLQQLDEQSHGQESVQSMWEKTKKAAMKGGLFGAAAGTIQVVALMWMRTIINYQYRYGVSFEQAVRSLYQEGGLLRFYRGMAYALVQNPLAKFGAIAANEGALMVISQLTGIENASPVLASLLGTVFSVTWRLLLMPLETCKTILQVDGAAGMTNMWKHILHGNFGVLYEGSAATMLATVTSHYPWFFVYNYLDEMISKPHDTKGVVIRSAIIGFLSSAVSDTVSNCLRVIKTVKQTMAASGHTTASGTLSYWDVVSHVYEESGWQGLVGRGLATRIVANGIQSVVFTVLWKLLPLYFARQARATPPNKEEDLQHEDSGRK
jgi:hypothetical protein